MKACIAEVRPISVGSNMRLELAQSVDAGIGRIACDDGSVNRSDRHAGDPLGMDAGLRRAS
jgi:hypothetical protein